LLANRPISFGVSHRRRSFPVELWWKNCTPAPTALDDRVAECSLAANLLSISVELRLIALVVNTE